MTTDQCNVFLVPVEDELSMPLGTERRPLSQEEPSAIIEPEDQQAESAKPPAVEEGEILESEKKHEEETKRPEKIIGAEQRMEEEQEITKHHDVDISPALKPESEPDKKQQPLEACICSPQICRPVSTYVNLDLVPIESPIQRFLVSINWFPELRLFMAFRLLRN